VIGLNPFQEHLLEAFFARETGFFLTGSTALAGYHLHHRVTENLELCTLEDRVRVGEAALLEAASDAGAKVQRLPADESCGRFLLRRGEDSLVVDIKRDTGPQVDPEKTVIGNILVDGPNDITVKKMCALLADAEVNDLIDLRALEIAGYTIEDHIGSAARKDPEMTPAELVRVLSEFEIDNNAEIPSDVDPADLRSYLAVLVLRLTSMAART